MAASNYYAELEAERRINMELAAELCMAREAIKLLREMLDKLRGKVVSGSGDRVASDAWTDGDPSYCRRCGLKAEG